MPTVTEKQLNGKEQEKICIASQPSTPGTQPGSAGLPSGGCALGGAGWGDCSAWRGDPPILNFSSSDIY